MRYDYDLETTSLQIKTDSVVGQLLRVFFYDGLGDDAGGLGITFVDPPEFKILYCSQQLVSSSDLPAQLSKIWTITKTAKTLKIACNDVEMMIFTFSESAKDTCVPYFSRDVEKILFQKLDTASDEFRASNPGTKIHF